MNPTAHPPPPPACSEEMQARYRALDGRPVVIEVRDVAKRFGGDAPALENISFSLHRREFVCVLGPSGCGKSTLLRLLAGLDKPSTGSILLDGKPVTGPGPDRGMVFQGYTLFPWLTVKRNVMFGLEMRGEVYADARAREWLDLVGLLKFANHYPSQLSGGMRQRVAIARALAAQPQVLLMDEPFGALDPHTRTQMQSYLLEIWKNIAITIFFVTHDLDEAIFLSDRILVLDTNPGRIRHLVDNPVPRPRSPAQFSSAEFLELKRWLEVLVHPEEAPLVLDKLPITRLTKVGDDAE